MRITLTKSITAVLLVIIVVLTWTVVKDTNDDKREVKNCKLSDEFLTKLHDLAFRVHTILSKLNLTHFLCYGALWGQIRASKTLPWVQDVELCVLNEELYHIEEAQLYRLFNKNGLNIMYKSSDGIYIVNDPTFADGKVELYVFEQDKMTKMYRRIGWKRRVLPPNCETIKSLQCFPPNLITSPLPKKEFGGYIFPVPREGIEMQKYHYEHNWWKEVKPKNC